MITLIVELSCDHDDCNLAYAPDAAELTSVMATRSGSRKAGWTRRDGKDFCPEHSHGETGALVGLIAGLAAKHFTDTEIGAALGMNRWQVQSLRKRHNIPAGVKPGRPARGAA